MAPQSTLQSNVGSPTPNAIPVGKIISTVLLEEEIHAVLAALAETRVG